MKTIIIILLFVSSISYGQNCSFDKSFEKILIMETAVITYGVIDYVAYNSFGKDNIEQYRFVQGIIFSAINYGLSRISNKLALGFTLQVLGGVPDMAYYGLDKLYGHKNGFSNGNEFNMNKNLNHLSFMPTVLGSGRAKGIDLITNSILTTVISITINL